MSSTVTATATEVTPPPLSFLQRVIGVFTSPARVFESLRARPVWIDVAVLYLVVAVLSFVPMQPIVKKQSIEQARERIESADMPQEQKDRAIESQERIMDKMLSVPAGVAMAIVTTAIAFVIWALIIWFGFGFMAGGRLSFVQALSAVSHLSLIILLGGLVKLPLILAKQSMYVATSPAVLLPEFDPKSMAFAMLNAFDIFTIWTLIAMAIGMVGLANISRGKSRAVTIGIFVLVLLMSAGGAMLNNMGQSAGR